MDKKKQDLKSRAVEEGWEEEVLEPEEGDFGPEGHRICVLKESIVYDSCNIPVAIFLHAISKEDDKTLCEQYPWAKYRLQADNYMPGKPTVIEAFYDIIAEDVEDLKTILREKVLPLYQAAVAKLEKTIEYGEGSLYYWEEL